MKYKLTDDCPFYTVEVRNPDTGILTKEVKRGLVIFGLQSGVLTEDKLTDDIVDFVRTNRPEQYKYLVVEEKKYKKVNN